MRMYRHLLITQSALLSTSAYKQSGSGAPSTLRAPSLFQQQLVWETFCDRQGTRSDFKTHLRMTKASFHKLLMNMQYDLEVDEGKARSRGGAILP
jgi:hypothetical protein